jgi:hypothetical protein
VGGQGHAPTPSPSPQLHHAPFPASPPRKYRKRPGRSASLQRDRGEGFPGSWGRGCAAPVAFTCPLPAPPPSSKAPRPPPPPRVLSGHSGAGAEAPGRSPSWRGRGGAAQLRQQPREGILGSGSAPSRAHGAGPRAARVTAASAGAERLPRVGGRAQRRESRASAPAPSPQASGPPPLPLFAQEMGEAKMLSAMLA